MKRDDYKQTLKDIGLTREQKMKIVLVIEDLMNKYDPFVPQESGEMAGMAKIHSFFVGDALQNNPHMFED